MTPSDLRLPYLSETQIESIAEQFLAQVNLGHAKPVNIEWIVEKDGFDIIPVPRLRADFDLDGCTNLSEKRIYVDETLIEDYENRYRFTLAHEMGHVRLHPQLFAVMDKAPFTTKAWIRRQEIIPDEVYKRADFQAHRFATFVLMPRTPLLAELKSQLRVVKQGVSAAIREGARKESAWDYGWETLAEQLAQGFSVSKNVAEHRLRFAGHSPRTLFA